MFSCVEIWCKLTDAMCTSPWSLHDVEGGGGGAQLAILTTPNGMLCRATQLSAVIFFLSIRQVVSLLLCTQSHTITKHINSLHMNARTF